MSFAFDSVGLFIGASVACTFVYATIEFIRHKE